MREDQGGLGLKLGAGGGRWPSFYPRAPESALECPRGSLYWGEASVRIPKLPGAPATHPHLWPRFPPRSCASLGLLALTPRHPFLPSHGAVCPAPPLAGTQRTLVGEWGTQEHTHLRLTLAWVAPVTWQRGAGL